MLNVCLHIKSAITSAIKELCSKNSLTISDSDFARFSVEEAREKSHGDLASNAAMVLVKNFSSTTFNSPQKLAQAICDIVKSEPSIQKIEVAGAGFINIFLSHSILASVIYDVASVDASEIRFADIGCAKSVNLEYASPNPTGPVHIGHARGAIYGDVLANLLRKVGYKVLKEYYINDAGVQVENLVKSAYFRYLESCGKGKFEELCGENKNLYPGEYLISIGSDIEEKFGDSINDQNYKEKIRDFVLDSMMKMIIEDLGLIGVKHDSYFSEKKMLHDKGRVDEAINILDKKGLIYQGKIEAPKSSKAIVDEEYEDKVQTIFKSTQFGDDCDRVMRKSDGVPTYIAGDAALALSKYERGAELFIMPLGYDHAGYVKRLSAIVDAITESKSKVVVILCQMVKLVRDGKQLKMSKRAGDFVTVRDVVEEVGSDVLRLIMLTRKNDVHLDFDLSKVVEQSKDNPVFYIQYAHARCCSILRKVDDNLREIAEKKDFKNVDLSVLSSEAELELMKKIALYPKVIELSAINFEPHKIAFYLQELASRFHALWNKGSEDESLKFIIPEDKNLTLARICLVVATRNVIASAFDIFGIKPVSEMR